MRVVIQPYTGAADITPDDDSVVAPTRAVMCAVTGDITVVMVDGSSATITAAIPGKDYPLSVVKVMSTGTDATGIVALY